MPDNPVKIDKSPPNSPQIKQTPSQRNLRVTVGGQSYLIDLEVTGIMYWKYLQIAISNPLAAS